MHAGFAIIMTGCLTACGRVGFEGLSDVVLGGDAGNGTLDAGTCSLRAASGNQTRPAVASNGQGEFLVVWEDDRAGTADVYGARVTASGVIDTAGIAIDRGGMYQRHGVSVASNGASYYVAWRLDTPGPGPDAHGILVQGGAPVGTPANLSAEVEFGAFANTTNTAAAAIPGGGFFVTWGGHGGGTKLAGRSIAADGMPQSGSVYCSEITSGFRPAVAFGADMYMIPYGTGQQNALASARVSLAASELGCGTIEPTNAVCDLACSAAAFDDTDFVVAWQDGGGVHVARIDVSGAVLDTGGVLFAAAGEQPAIAAQTGSSVVVWTEAGSVRSRPLSGGVPGPVTAAVTTSGNAPKYPAIAFDGSRFLVVVETTGASTGQNIEGWFLNADGDVSSTPFVISGNGCQG